MTDPVLQDEAKHQRQLAQDEAREEWRDEMANDVCAAWKKELRETGIIEDLGYEQADVNHIGAELGKSFDETLSSLAYIWVVDNEDEILQKNIGWE